MCRIVEKRGCFGFDPIHREGKGSFNTLSGHSLYEGGVGISKEFDSHERAYFVVRSDPMAIRGSFHYMKNIRRLVTLSIMFGS